MNGPGPARFLQPGRSTNTDGIKWKRRKSLWFFYTFIAGEGMTICIYEWCPLQPIPDKAAGVGVDPGLREDTTVLRVACTLGDPNVALAVI